MAIHEGNHASGIMAQPGASPVGVVGDGHRTRLGGGRRILDNPAARLFGRLSGDALGGIGGDQRFASAVGELHRRDRLADVAVTLRGISLFRPGIWPIAAAKSEVVLIIAERILIAY